MGLQQRLIDLLKPALEIPNLLIGHLQSQFLLMLHAVTEAEERVQRKSEGHDQLGSCSSLETLSANDTASPAFWFKKRCSSGINTSALSKVPSLPFW